MDLTYVMEYRFRRSADGSIWTDTSYGYSHWQRYLDVFGNVFVVARVVDSAVPAGWTRVDGPGLSVEPVPHYLGAAEYARRAFAVRAAVHRAVSRRSAVILRIPSQLCAAAAGYLTRHGRPFGVEVVGDPHQVFAPGVTPHLARPLLRWFYSRTQASQCRGAVAVAYVTPRLRQLYPPGPQAYSVDCSDVTLPGEAFVEEPRAWQSTDNIRLITVATLSQMYKGIDVLLEALSICLLARPGLSLTVVGDGKFRSTLEGLARSLGVESNVRFAGALPAGRPVRSELDAADIFVLPSRTEGMPRALLEAMARGLPCIASNVGGISDVLSPGNTVEAGDPVALAATIREVIASRERMAHMSAVSLSRASQFRAEILRPAWHRYCRELHDRTYTCFDGPHRANQREVLLPEL